MVCGKLRPEILTKYVFGRVGAVDPSVLVGPSIGEDAAVIDLGNGNVLVVHVDPISGAVEHLGWLAVHIPSNDVAVSGARPRWLLPVIYLPEDSGVELVDKITEQMNAAAKEINAMIVGGHSEYTPGIKRPLISMTSMGITTLNMYVRSSGARPGDVVLMTKRAGIEGTLILASDFAEVLMDRGISRDLISKAREMVKDISVVKEALLLAEDGLPTSMHDPTEGGVLGGLLELAYASNTSIVIYEDSIPIARETEVFCNALGLDPLKILSSGALIATVPADKLDDAIRKLGAAGINASVIGEVVPRSEYLVKIFRKGGEVITVNDVYVSDEIIGLWAEGSQRPRR